jgi:hypothetical protein
MTSLSFTFVSWPNFVLVFIESHAVGIHFAILLTISVGKIPVSNNVNFLGVRGDFKKPGTRKLMIHRIYSFYTDFRSELGIYPHEF